MYIYMYHTVYDIMVVFRPTKIYVHGKKKMYVPHTTALTVIRVAIC